MKNRLLPLWCFALFMALVLLVSPALVNAQATDAVTAADQDSDGSSVTVAGVTAAVPGWMVIHLDDNGSPGPVLGQAAVPAGDSSDVVVTLDPPLAADTALWAMLHVDEGVIGEYEFPGADVPVRDGTMVVMTPFTAAVAVMGTDATPAETEVMTETAETAVAETEVMTETAEAAVAETEVVTETAEAAVAETEIVTETAEAAVAETEIVTETAEAYVAETETVTDTAEAEVAEPAMAEPSAPEVLPVTGAGMGSVGLALPAALAALSVLAGGVWANRRRRG